MLVRGVAAHLVDGGVGHVEQRLKLYQLGGGELQIGDGHREVDADLQRRVEHLLEGDLEAGLPALGEDVLVGALGERAPGFLDELPALALDRLHLGLEELRQLGELIGDGAGQLLAEDAGLEDVLALEESDLHG